VLAQLEAGGAPGVARAAEPAAVEGQEQEVAGATAGDEAPERCSPRGSPALRRARATDLRPEAERRSGRKFEAVEAAHRDPQVLDLAVLERPLERVLGRP